MNRIAIAQTDDEILRCFPVVRQLRPRFDREDFLAQVKRQMKSAGFRLIYLAKDGEIKAVGGIRINEWLAGGKYLEIEDLVTAENERSKGSGGELFDWIADYAARENCDEIKLVSRVDRFAAHRFYLNKRMIIEAHYFSLKINE